MMFRKMRLRRWPRVALESSSISSSKYACQDCAESAQHAVSCRVLRAACRVEKRPRGRKRLVVERLARGGT